MQGDTPQPDGHAGTIQPSEMSRVDQFLRLVIDPAGHVAELAGQPQSTVRILLTSRFPMWMAWGPELTFLYNDAYARTRWARSIPGPWASRRRKCGARSGKTSVRVFERVMETGRGIVG